MFSTAISTIRRPFSGISPTAPPASSPSDPRIDVNGVRSSWLTTETNSSFIRSTSWRWVTSRNTATDDSEACSRGRGDRRLGGEAGAVAALDRDVVAEEGTILGELAEDLREEGVVGRADRQDVGHDLAEELVAIESQQLAGGVVGEHDATLVEAEDAVGDRAQRELLQLGGVGQRLRPVGDRLLEPARRGAGSRGAS